MASTSLRRRVLADSISNVAANLVTAGFSFIGALITARILGPSGTGLTAAAVTLVLNYTINAHFGILNAVSQRYPTLMGIGTEEAHSEAESMLRIALGAVIVGGGAVVLGGWIVALWHARTSSTLAAIGIAFGGTIGGVQLIKTYYLFVVRAKNEFAYLGRYTLYFAWVPLAWLLGAWAGGVVGQWIAMGLTEVAMCTALFAAIGRSLRPEFSLAGSWRYVRYGFPIWVVGTLFIVFTTADRVATASLLGTRDLGLYGAASMAGTLLALVPGILTQIMWPRIAEALAAAGSEWRTTLPLIEKPTFLVAYLLPPIIGIFVLVIPEATTILLPKYVAGIPAARIAILSVFSLGLIGMYGVFLGTSLRLTAYGSITAIGVAGVALGSMVAVRLGFGLVGIAWAKTLAHATVAICLMLYSWREYGQPGRWMVRRLVVYFAPMLWIGVVVFMIIPQILATDVSTRWHALFATVEQVALLGVFSSPLIWIALHHGGIADDVKAMFLRRSRPVEAVD